MALFNGDVRQNINTLSSLMQLVLLPLMGWILITLVSMDKRIVAIESNRFTVNDGAAMLSEIRKIERNMPRADIEARLRRIEMHLAATSSFTVQE